MKKIHIVSYTIPMLLELLVAGELAYRSFTGEDMKQRMTTLAGALIFTALALRCLGGLVDVCSSKGGIGQVIDSMAVAAVVCSAAVVYLRNNNYSFETVIYVVLAIFVLLTFIGSLFRNGKKSGADRRSDSSNTEDPQGGQNV